MNSLLLSFFFTGCAAVLGPLQNTPHYDGSRFYNENREVKGRKSLFDVLKWKLGGAEKEEEIACPQEVGTPNLPSSITKDEVFVTYVNHATILIQFEGWTILTDPVFSEYVGPFSLVGIKRKQKAGLQLTDLPPIDLVLISHNHYDHLDLPSIKQLLERDNPIFVLPLKNGDLLKDVGAQKIVELDWWDSYLPSATRKIVLTPAQHWSARGLFDASKSLWGGFVIIKDDMKVFFAGDTGYASHFKQIYDRIGAMDVSLLPIGCYKPRWFMKEMHMDPEDAVMAHLDLHSTLSMGIHFGTFKLADESVCQPAVELSAALKKREMPQSQFIAPLNGQTLSFKKS